MLAPDTEASVFAALALLTGMREGEVCGVRWRDIDLRAVPLGALHLRTQYGGGLLKIERTANEHSRKIAIHPALAAKLAWWWREGFELMNCRKPTPDDFVVARRDHGRVERLVHHTKKTGSTLWDRACGEAGVQNLTLHATRHTFITLARRGGARTEVVEQITHNARGTIVDHYTHWDWQPLCQAVLALQLPTSRELQPPRAAARVAKNVATLAAATAITEEKWWRRRESKLEPDPGKRGKSRKKTQLRTGTPTHQIPAVSAIAPPSAPRVNGTFPLPENTSVPSSTAL